MSLAEKWGEVIGKAISHRGYVVLGSYLELNIGIVVDRILFATLIIQHPYRIISRTDFEDYKAQCILTGLKYPTNFCSEAYFYRAITD